VPASTRGLDSVSVWVRNIAQIAGFVVLRAGCRRPPARRGVLSARPPFGSSWFPLCFSGFKSCGGLIVHNSPSIIYNRPRSNRNRQPSQSHLNIQLQPPNRPLERQTPPSPPSAHHFGRNPVGTAASAPRPRSLLHSAGPTLGLALLVPEPPPRLTGLGGALRMTGDPGCCPGAGAGR